VEYKNLKIGYNTDNKVELLFDTPKPYTNQYGDSFLYGLKKDGEEMNFFATPTLNNILSRFTKGDVVNIRKEESENGKTKWDVKKIAENNTQSNQQIQNANTGVIDARTHDIHKQVCLKLAIEMRTNSNEILTDSDLVIIGANMKNLLNVLEGTTEPEEEMPF